MVATGATGSSLPTLIYDGECRVCTLFSGLLELADLRKILRVLPYQSGIARELLRGWTQDEIAKAVHLVMPDGRVYHAGEAFLWTIALLTRVGPGQRRFLTSRTVTRIVGALYGIGVAIRGLTRCASTT